MIQLGDCIEGLEYNLDLVRDRQSLDIGAEKGRVHSVTVKLICPLIRI